MNLNNYSKWVVAILVVLCAGNVFGQAPQQTKDGATIVDLKIKHNSQFGANYDDWKVNFLNARAPQAILAPGFPRQIDTGDPQADAANYEAAKLQWISTNGEAYEAAMVAETRNTLRRAMPQNDGSTIFLIGIGTPMDASQANQFDSKVTSQLGVLSVQTNPQSRICRLRLKTGDEHNVLLNVFGIVY